MKSVLKEIIAKRRAQIRRGEKPTTTIISEIRAEMKRRRAATKPTPEPVKEKPESKGEWKEVGTAHGTAEMRVSHVDEQGKTHYEFRAIPSRTVGTSEENKTYTSHVGIAKSERIAAKEKQEQARIAMEEAGITVTKEGEIKGKGFTIHPSYGPPEKRWELASQYVAKEQMAKELAQYRSTGEIPSRVREQISLPPGYEGIEQKERLERLFEERAYRKYLDMPVSETESEIEKLFRASKWYMKTKAVYTGGKTFEELKGEEPALYLVKKPTGEYGVEYDIKRWKGEQWAELSKQGVGGYLTKVGQLGSSAVLALFDFDYWGAVAGGRGGEYLYEKEYQAGKEIRAGKGLKVWAGLQMPAYETVILPLATAGAFKYISVGAKVAKAGTVTAGAYRYFVIPTTKVIQYVAIPTIVGTEIGTTAAKEFHLKEVPPGTTVGKIAGVTTAFTMFGAGLKYWDVPSKTLTGIGQKMKTTFYKQFPSAKQIRADISEFKQYGIQRQDVTWQRIRHKYLTPMAKELSTFKFEYKQAFRGQFPRAASTVKQISAFKKLGVQRNIVFGERLGYKIQRVKQKVSDLYPKHEVRNILSEIKSKVIRGTKAYVGEKKPLVFEEIVGKKAKTPKQYTFEDYQRRQALKWPAKGKGLEGTKPLDTKFKPPEHKPMSLEEIYTKMGREAKVEFLKRAGLGKVVKQKALKLEISKKPDIFIDETMQVTTMKMKPMKMKPLGTKFKPPEHKPMPIEEIYTKMRAEARAEFLKGKAIGKVEQKILPIKYTKTKYLITAKGGKIEFAKLEAAPDILVKGKTPFKFPKSEVITKDVVSKKPVSDTTKLITKKPITQYEWYQAPAKDIIYVPGDLRLLSFLEEAEVGIGVKSDYWKDVKPILEERREQKLTLEPKTIIEPIQKGEMKVGVFRMQIQEKDLGIKQEMLQDLVQEIDVKKDVLQDVIQLQQMDLLKGLRTKYELETELITEPIVEPVKEKIIIPPPIPPPPEGMKEPEKYIGKPKVPAGAFDVLVKERTMYHGKVRKPTRFKRVNLEPLDYESALALGGTIADETSAISFKLRPTKGKPSKPSRLTKHWEDIKHKFIKRGDVFIEKTPHRIDTEGEIKGISALGVRARRAKGLKTDFRKELGTRKKQDLLGTKTFVEKPKIIRTTKKSKRRTSLEKELFSRKKTDLLGKKKKKKLLNEGRGGKNIRYF